MNEKQENTVMLMAKRVWFRGSNGRCLHAGCKWTYIIEDEDDTYFLVQSSTARRLSYATHHPAGRYYGWGKYN